MTTRRQIEANRRNAQESTGPRTTGGKATSSGNARRHGLTGGLDENVILSWYRLLLEDEAATPDPFDQDPYRHAALELARAEAHLRRVSANEEQSLRVMEGPSKAEEELEHERDRVAETLIWNTLRDGAAEDLFRLVPEDEQWLLPDPPPAPPIEDEDFDARLAELGNSFGMKFELPPVDQAALQAEFEAASDVYFTKLNAFVYSPLVETGWDKEGFGIMRRLDQAIEHIRSERREAFHEKAPTFSRYRALAEARRERALSRWTDQVSRRNQLRGSE